MPVRKEENFTESFGPTSILLAFPCQETGKQSTIDIQATRYKLG